MIEVFVLSVFIIIEFIENGLFSEIIFFYNSFVWISIFINTLAILISWVIKKVFKGY